MVRTAATASLGCGRGDGPDGGREQGQEVEVGDVVKQGAVAVLEQLAGQVAAVMPGQAGGQAVLCR